MVSIAALLNLFMIYTRNMREFAMVAVWAIIAIAIRHWGEIPSLQWVCVFWAVVLFVTIAVHGYKNRNTRSYNREKNRFRYIFKFNGTFF